MNILYWIVVWIWGWIGIILWLKYNAGNIKKELSDESEREYLEHYDLSPDRIDAIFNWKNYAILFFIWPITLFGGFYYRIKFSLRSKK